MTGIHTQKEAAKASPSLCKTERSLGDASKTGKEVPLGQKILVQLTHLLNRFLQLDPDLHYIIQPLVGYSVQLHVVDYPVNAAIKICEDGFLIEFTPQECSVVLTGRLVSLVQLCISKNPSAFIQQQEILLEGSVKVLMEFNRFCSRFSPDIEGALEKWIGAPLAHHVVRASSTSQQWLKKNFKLAEADFIEFLQQELKLIPSMQEFKALASDIQDIQSDMDRFEAKMNALLHEH